MKLKEYLGYKKTMTRGELMMICLASSIPPCGWIALIILVLFKPHFKGGAWKKHKLLESKDRK